MAGVARKLQFLFPDANSFFDWRVVNDGVTGDVITYWNEKVLGEQPKQDVLDAITDQQIADGIAARQKQEAKDTAKAGSDTRALLAEINTLRAYLALPPRTVDDIVAGIKQEIEIAVAAEVAEVK